MGSHPGIGSDRLVSISNKETIAPALKKQLRAKHRFFSYTGKNDRFGIPK